MKTENTTPSFVHLHLNTNYSFNHGLVESRAAADFCKEKGITACHADHQRHQRLVVGKSRPHTAKHGQKKGSTDGDVAWHLLRRGKKTRVQRRLHHENMESTAIPLNVLLPQSPCRRPRPSPVSCRLYQGDVTLL